MSFVQWDKQSTILVLGLGYQQTKAGLSPSIYNYSGFTDKRLKWW
jgi:hypothetical protein